MAQPIAFHASGKPASHSEQLRNAPEEHAEAVLSAYELVQVLHERGVLSLLRGLVGSGDEVIGKITSSVNTPEAIQGIRNFLLLTKFFAGIPPAVLQSLGDAVNAGAERKRSHKAPGLWNLLWRLRNENSRHAAAVALDLLEAAGKGL